MLCDYFFIFFSIRSTSNSVDYESVWKHFDSISGRDGATSATAKDLFFDLSDTSISTLHEKPLAWGEICQQAGMLILTFGAMHQGFGEVHFFLSCFTLIKFFFLEFG